MAAVVSVCTSALILGSSSVAGFSPTAFLPNGRLPSTVLYESSDGGTAVATTNLLTLSLEKPLGMILEEVEEGAAKGVVVQEVGEGGSAFEYAEKITGLKVATVMGADVTALDFDSIMDKLIEAPSPLSVEFELKEGQEADGSSAATTEGGDAAADVTEYEVGTVVSITVLQKGKPDVTFEAKVGDNLRKAMLENGVEVYTGLKEKLGNCGGSGTCTFCAADFIESDGWLERSDYEDQKLKKYPNARLSCLNNIQGPATVRM